MDPAFVVFEMRDVMFALAILVELIPTVINVDTFMSFLGCGLYSLAMLAQPDAFCCGLYSLAALAQPDRRTRSSLMPRGAFLAVLGVACWECGRSLRSSGLVPAWAAAVAAFMLASKRVILNSRWFYVIFSLV